MTNRYYDNTRIKDYRGCPRYFYFRHIRGWRRDGIGLALINGLAWHDAMDVIWDWGRSEISNQDLLAKGMEAYVSTWTGNGLIGPDQIGPEQAQAMAPRGPFIAREIMWNYILKRRQFITDHELLDIERPFAVPIENRSDGVTYYIGRLDKTIKHQQYGITIVEHKTTTSYDKTKGLRSNFVDSFSPNSQVDGYIFSANMIYPERVSGVWIDATLFHKTVHDTIKFLPVDRVFEMIDNWLDETHVWIERIENDKEKLATSGLTKGAFPKNTDNCDSYAGCPYRDICKFHVDPSRLETAPPGYVTDPWYPFDILKIDKLGLQREENASNE